MKKLRKSTMLITVVALLASLIVGCSGNNNNSPASSNNGGANDKGTNNAPANNNGGEGAEPAAFTKYDPPVTLTTAIALRESDKLMYGDTHENNPLSRWANETLGIHIEYKWLLTDQNDALNQKIRLSLASGEAIPDVLYVADVVIMNELIEAGALESVDEAFEKYATPRMREAYDKNASVWGTATKDGKRWGLPQISDGIVGDPVMWIRQDWLDAVGMKAPTTIEEMDAVLKAFKEKYPKSAPLALAGKNGLSGWMGDTQFMFGSNQILIWDEGEDGKLRYGSIQPSVKTGLTKLNDWYKNQYISSEFGTHDEQKAAALFTSGESGIIFGPGWMGGWPLSDTEKNVQGAVVKAYPIPAGADGTVGRTGSKLSYGTYVFRKGFDKWEGIFAYWDAMLGKELQDETSVFANGFAEGYDYVMKDGQPVWKDAPGPAAGTEIQRFRLMSPGNTPPGMVEGPSIYERVLSGKRDTVYERQLAETSTPLSLEGFSTALNQADVARRNLFVGAPTATMMEKWALISKMEVEFFLKFIYGNSTAEDFDAFVADWKAKGGDKITEEVNAWYEASK